MSAFTDWPWERIVGRRLIHSHLARPASSDRAVQVVRDVCGLQAQVPAAAELGVAVRTKGLTRATLQRVIEADRSLTRTYAMRGTAHLLAADEVPLYMAAMRHFYGGNAWFERFGLNRQEADDLFRALAGILNSRTLDRQALIAALKREAGEWVFGIFDETLADLVVAAAYAGVLAYGPSQGGHATFVLPEQGDNEWQNIDEVRAAKELIRRYVRTYGPVTHNDLARWLAMKPGEAQALIDSLSDELVAVQVFGKKAWLLAAEAGPPNEKIRNNVKLIPQYDQYILGAGPLERVVPAKARELIAAYKGGRYEGGAGVPVLLIDGVFAGTWRRELKERRLAIAVQSLEKLTVTQCDLIGDEAERIAVFLEARLALEIK